MSSLQARIDSVRNYLASQFMNVDEEWISGCVEYITEDISNNYTLTEIQNLAKEQWLLNELKDICPGCLPANVKEIPKTILNGKYVLQINATIDIGTPAYQQYLKLQKTNMENIEATSNFEERIPSHRMIKLYLTDGKQEVAGIEYRPMRNLSCDITPGCKMLLKGPVECRHGVIFLTESSVELLGGEVQELVAEHALPQLLANKLQLPPPAETEHNTTLSIPRNSNIPTPHTTVPPLRPTDAPTSQLLDQPSRPIARVTSVQVANFADDDIDIDQIAEIEAEFSNKRSLDSSSLPNPEKKLKTADISKENPVRNDNYSVRNDNYPVRTNNYPDRTDNYPVRTDNYSVRTDNYPVRSDNYPVRTDNNRDEYPDENDFNEDEDYLREMEAVFDRKEALGPVAVSSEPFVYIKQILNMDATAKAGRVFRVKGQIMKLLSKLSVGKDGWSLKCTIIDGTGNLDVDFTSDVLSKLVGYTPSEMNKLKKQMASKPELKEMAVSALQKAKESLQVLYCIIELTILDTPKITALIQFDESHARMLKKRLEDSGL